MKENVVEIVLISIAGVILIAGVARGIWQQARIKSAHSRRLAHLRTNLLLKTFGNESTVDSLIEYERKRSGNLPIEILMEDAIYRWEHDNR